MARPNESTLAIEPLVDDFMRNLDDMLAKHDGKWTVFGGSEGKPLGFYDSFVDAHTSGTVHFGITAPLLVRQVSEDYKIYGKNGRSYEIAELSE